MIDINATKKSIEAWERKIKEMDKSIAILQQVRPDDDISHVLRERELYANKIAYAAKTLQLEVDLIDALRFVRDKAIVMRDGKSEQFPCDWQEVLDVIKTALDNYRGHQSNWGASMIAHQ